MDMNSTPFEEKKNGIKSVLQLDEKITEEPNLI